MLFQPEQWLRELGATGASLGIRELLYYRNKTMYMDLTPKKAIHAKMAGTYLARSKGRGMEFDEARHYQPGDDIRSIDWRVTARTGKTHTKLYREEKERPVFVLVDLSSSMYFGTRLLFKSVQAAHLAALIAWSAQKRGDRIGGLIFNQQQHREYKPFTRAKAVLTLLGGIEQHHQPDGTHGHMHLTDACARLRRLAHPGSKIFIISDFLQLDDASVRHIHHLTRHCEVTACVISDPFEHQLPDVSVPQQLAITDGDIQQKLWLGDKDAAKSYQQNHARMYASIEQQLQQAKASIMAIDAALPLTMQLGQPR